MVGAVAADFVLPDEHSFPRLDCRVLFSCAAVQLPALHGYGLSRVSHADGDSEISPVHRARRVAPGGGWLGCAPVVPAAAVDFHAVHLLEPVALHGTKLRAIDDVRATLGASAG